MKILLNWFIAWQYTKLYESEFKMNVNHSRAAQQMHAEAAQQIREIIEKSTKIPSLVKRIFEEALELTGGFFRGVLVYSGEDPSEDLLGRKVADAYAYIYSQGGGKILESLKWDIAGFCLRDLGRGRIEHAGYGVYIGPAVGIDDWLRSGTNVKKISDLSFIRFEAARQIAELIHVSNKIPQEIKEILWEILIITKGFAGSIFLCSGGDAQTDILDKQIAEAANLIFREGGKDILKYFGLRWHIEGLRSENNEAPVYGVYIGPAGEREEWLNSEPVILAFSDVWSYPYALAAQKRQVPSPDSQSQTLAMP